MAGVITKNQLENASLDADSLQTFVNGGENEVVHTRLGIEYETLSALAKRVRDSLHKPAPFDFESGGTLEVGTRNIVVLWPISGGGDGDYYYWNGALPKVIPPNSSPQSTGGIGEDAWKPMGDITLRGDLTSTGEGKGADMIPLIQGGSVQDSVHSITPEMFGAVGDGVADDSDAIQKALKYAYDSKNYRVIGMKRYLVSKPIAVDDFGQGLSFYLQAIIASDTFPTTADWKTANGLIHVGENSNGSQVGLDIRLGFVHGKDRATTFKLIRQGAGGSLFFAGRVTNCIGVVDITNSNVSNSNSNLIQGLYWLNGVYGVRLRGASPRVVEGTKIQVPFMTGLRYGGIQLFAGSQYFDISGTGIDFCGRNLTQLTLSALPAATVRETMLTNNATGVQFEILDVYPFQGTNNVLVIEPQSSEGGSKNFSPGQTVTIAGTQYSINTVTTSQTSRAYFDFIHGFHGAPFSRGKASFDYLSRAVGGNFNATVMFWFNSFSETNHSINNIWLRQQGIAASIVDRNTAMTLIRWDTVNGGNATIPGGLTTGTGNSQFNGTVTYTAQQYTAANRVYGSERSTTLAQNVAQDIRTFAFIGDGTVKGTKEMYDVYVAGPTGLSGVGGVATLLVGSNGIEVRPDNVQGVALSASGYTLRAIQNSQANMLTTFMFIRRM